MNIQMNKETRKQGHARDCTICTCASNRTIRNAGLLTGAILFGLMSLFNS